MVLSYTEELLCVILVIILSNGHPLSSRRSIFRKGWGYFIHNALKMHKASTPLGNNRLEVTVLPPGE